MRVFRCILATPEKKLIEKTVLRAVLPVVDGEVTILADHVPYIAALRAGEVRIVDEREYEESIAISGGFLEFAKNILTILVDTAEHAEEIDMERAQKALERAEAAKHEKRLGEEEYALVAAQLEKELARLRVARKRKM